MNEGLVFLHRAYFLNKLKLKHKQMNIEQRLPFLRTALFASELGELSIGIIEGEILEGTWAPELHSSDPTTAAVVLAVMNESNEDISDIISELQYTQSLLYKVIRTLDYK